MAVQKAVDLIGTGDTIQDAVVEALDRALLTLSGVESFEVRAISGTLRDGRPGYRVRLRIWFTLLEQMHG